jgi:hypothetical protein
LISIAIVGLVALSLGAAGLVYAQSQTPTPGTPGNGPGVMGGQGAQYGYGRGASTMGAGRGANAFGPGMGWQAANGSPGSGVLHTYMVAALAQQLGLTTDELQSRLAGGETAWQIAQSQGLSAEQVSSLIQSAHDTALQQAVAGGSLTQEQADWMDDHMQGMWGNGGGYGPGLGPCRGVYGNTQP